MEFKKEVIIIHELKLKVKHYNDIINGIKKFEIRKNDRNYQVGDTIRLFEIDESGAFTGSKVLSVKIIYILRDTEGYKYGLRTGYCVINW